MSVGCSRRRFLPRRPANHIHLLEASYISSPKCLQDRQPCPRQGQRNPMHQHVTCSFTLTLTLLPRTKTSISSPRRDQVLHPVGALCVADGLLVPIKWPSSHPTFSLRRQSSSEPFFSFFPFCPLQIMKSFLLALLASSAFSHAQQLDWDVAYAKAKVALAKLSQDEKVGMVTGVMWEGGPCVGNTYQPKSIPYPSLCLQDSPLGIRFANPVTVFPAGINAGATWDRDLINARGIAMGAEAKGLGVHVQLGPVAGPLGKHNETS